MQNHLNEPFGQLVLAPDGTIVAAPEFFLRPLDTSVGDHIFNLFDIERTPRLNFLRFETRSPTLIEYHVVVESLYSDPYSFRYWFSHDTPENHSVFSIIDDTAVHRYEEWRFHQLRNLVTQDVQNVILAEFREQLTTLSLLTEALDQPNDNPTELYEKLRNVSLGLDSTINAIEQDFRDDDKAAAAEDAPIEIKDLIRTIPSWSTGSSTIEVNVDLGAASKVISDGFLFRVLHPVVLNAVEATQMRGGKVDVDIQMTDSLAGYVLFTIRDNGIGMDVHTLSRAEDPFFTTKEGHLGLGLPYARQYADEHEGRLSIRSSATGTTVSLGVPLLSKQE